MTHPAARSADCAPTDPARPWACTRRWSSLAASATTLAPRARPSSDCSAPSGDAASWPMLRMPRRQPFAGDRPDAPDQPDRQRVEERALIGRMHDDETRRAWPPARRSWPGAWCAPRRPRWAGRPRCALGARIRSPMTSTGPKRWTEPGHVEERLVDGDPLHERREVAQHRHDVDRRAAGTRRSARARTCRSGHRRFARQPDMPPCTPNRFASYDAASTTPPPTAIGRPRSDGSRSCSTDA